MAVRYHGSVTRRFDDLRGRRLAERPCRADAVARRSATGAGSGPRRSRAATWRPRADPVGDRVAGGARVVAVAPAQSRPHRAAGPATGRQRSDGRTAPSTDPRRPRSRRADRPVVTTCPAVGRASAAGGTDPAGAAACRAAGGDVPAGIGPSTRELATAASATVHALAVAPVVITSSSRTTRRSVGGQPVRDGVHARRRLAGAGQRRARRSRRTVTVQAQRGHHRGGPPSRARCAAQRRASRSDVRPAPTARGTGRDGPATAPGASVTGPAPRTVGSARASAPPKRAGQLAPAPLLVRQHRPPGGPRVLAQRDGRPGGPGTPPARTGPRPGRGRTPCTTPNPARSRQHRARRLERSDVCGERMDESCTRPPTIDRSARVERDRGRALAVLDAAARPARARTRPHRRAVGHHDRRGRARP